MPSKLELVTFYRFTVTVERYEKRGGGLRGTAQRFPAFGTRSGHQSQQGLRCRWHVKQLNNIYFCIDILRRFARHILRSSIRLRRTETSEFSDWKRAFFSDRDMREKCLWSDSCAIIQWNFCFSLFRGLLLLSDLLIWTSCQKFSWSRTGCINSSYVWNRKMPATKTSWESVSRNRYL